MIYFKIFALFIAEIPRYFQLHTMTGIALLTAFPRGCRLILKQIIHLANGYVLCDIIDNSSIF